MSTNDDPDDPTPDDAPEPDEPTPDTDDADEQPEIEDDEMADWSAVGDEVADDPDDEGDDQDDGDDEQAGDDVDDLGGMDPGQMDTSIGDIYCNALGLGAAVARDRWGELDEDKADAMDEYADLARQLEIDQYVDEWLRTQGGMSELSPGQAAMLMTLMFPMLVAMDDPALASNAMEGFDGF
ncbi:hypothetical protein ACFR9U_17150 [Halorientalis brevis]|uniref:Uncharacterized protein n=1 Tax=Halorientalis brevis TaxID=1126241 RepID=A0ABD6CFW4_9EURY|nr:hypothetical protein [Halorientalis brevis]